MTQPKKMAKKAERPSSIPVEWLRGMPAEDGQKVAEVWRNSTYLLDQLRKILLEDLGKIELDSETDYSNPNWQFVRADKNGRAKALNRVLDLLP